MPRLSIVIPFSGGSRLLETSLVSVLQNRPDDCEVLVACARRYGDPYGLEGEVRFVDAPRCGAVACWNQGIRAARGPVVHLLACGAEAMPDWADAALPHFGDGRVAAVAPLVLDADESTRVLAAGMAYGRGGTLRVLGAGAAHAIVSARTVLCPDATGAFYRKSAVENAGGLATDLGLPATLVDLGLLLEHAGWQTVLEPGCRIRVRRSLRQTAGAFRQALDAERLFWQWAPRLGLLTGLGLHGFAVAADCAGRLPYPSSAACLLGRIVGFLWGRSVGPQDERLKRLIERGRKRAPIAPPHFLGKPGRRPSASPSPVKGRAGRAKSPVQLRGGLG